MCVVTVSTPQKNDYTSWLAAIVVCFNYICGVVALPRISIVLSIALIAFLLYLIKLHKIRVYFSFLFIFASVVFAFIISLLVIPNSERTIDYLLRFLLYDLIAFLIGYQIINKENVIKYTVIIGLVGLPLLLTKDLMILKTNNRMGISYACLPVLIASIIGLRYEKRYKIMGIIILVAIFFKMYTYAPRGIWVLVVSCVGLLIFYRIIFGKTKKIRIISSIIVLLLAFLGFIYAICNIDDIIKSINQFLISTFNLHIYALDKYIRYLEQDKLLNGRDVIWTLAIECIQKNPLLGCGIGYIEDLTRGAYCHNIFLQSFCETGLFFGVPTIVYSVSLIHQILKQAVSRDEKQYIWLIFTFTVGWEMLLFSSVYWMYSPFWLFMGAYINNDKVFDYSSKE